ncbi:MULTISPECIES: hypothetical protein [Paenibacillus]|uniref:Uncharacterized protein n=1 Tax=Paenibacillus radicis (ex Gao et al. 2016) TaxID=1737354 RepID=A0A917HUQ1_9BACL|nr:MULTISPECIES: hypothetical protein [Paenibacillus]GGG89085.1 hypothetical protein GCM10010918_54710 [Paenibacillus radicis (ex Gao et al. 2016)]
MRFEDALFNWLQIQIVADGRPDDNAAKETRDFFVQILTEDHGVTELFLLKTDETMVHVKYVREGRSKLQLYPRESAEQLLSDIRSNPKYN